MRLVRQQQMQLDVFQLIHDVEPPLDYKFEVEKEGDSYYATLYERKRGQWILTLNTAGYNTPEEAIFYLFQQRSS